jgi:DNA-binding MarR family transcriptional regulator
MRRNAKVSAQLARAVRDACLCLHTQRAARVLARRYDAALRPIGLTNGQFSILMFLCRDRPSSISAVAELLRADRTTITAYLKPLVRAGLVEITRDPRDGRARVIAATAAGRRKLAAAMPRWRTAHRITSRAVTPTVALDTLRRLARPSEHRPVGSETSSD